MKRKALNIMLLILLTGRIFPQTGGDNVYEFLNLTHSGLAAALGGSIVSLQKSDLNMAYHNPGLLAEQMNKQFTLSYTNYFAGINYGMAMYSRSYKNKGSFACGVVYLNYGTFTEADAAGVITGTFSASEYAFPLIYSRSLDSLFSIGVNFRPVLSYLEKYSSFGFAIDIGAYWHSRSNLFSAGIVVKNAGYQVTTYTGEPHQNLPFEIQAGISRKLAYAPFRLSLTLRHLEKFDLTRQYTGTDGAGDTQPGSEFLENIARHIIAGAEILPHKNFYICGGYNYQRRKELQLESKVSTAGLSWGFGINTSVFDLEFGRATYHLAGSSTHISVILKTDNIYQKFRK